VSRETVTDRRFTCNGRERNTRNSHKFLAPSPPPAELFVLHPRTQEGNPLMARKVIRTHTHRQDLSLSLSATLFFPIAGYEDRVIQQIAKKEENAYYSGSLCLCVCVGSFSSFKQEERLNLAEVFERSEIPSLLCRRRLSESEDKRLHQPVIAL
jgi:hypothetical protein